MKVNMKLVKEKLQYAYDHYQKQKDDPSHNIDWLEHIINGVYIEDKDDEMWIIFRGTDPNENSDIVNLKFNAHKLPYPGVNPKIWVHTGLITLYDRPGCRGVIESKVAEALKKNPKKKFWVIGHSQGGGMAQLCAIDLQYKFGTAIEDNLNLVAVASMRVGNKYFVRSMNKRLKNSLLIWKGSDFVPHLPLRLMFYKTAGKQLHVNKRNIFSNIFNFFWAPIKFLVIGRQRHNNNPDHFISILTLLGMGPEWYFCEDHQVEDWKDFIVDTGKLSDKKVNRIKVK